MTYIREGEEEQATTAKGIDRPKRWNGEQKIDQAKAEGCEQC